MTNAQFATWLERNFNGYVARCIRATGLSRSTIEALRDGVYKPREPGAAPRPAPVPKYVELACAAVQAGVVEYDGGDDVPGILTPESARKAVAKALGVAAE